MNDQQRASAVRKLQALADRIKAGEDVGAVFYHRDGDRDGACNVWPDCALPEAMAAANATLGTLRNYASAVGWDDDAAESVEVGIMVPLMVGRLTLHDTTRTPLGLGCGIDYGLVDPDTYAGPRSTAQAALTDGGE
jgi:hypothetical protein